MNASMLAKLEQLTERHQEVGALLADPEIIGDNDRFRALSMEYAQLEPVASGFLAYRRTLDDLDGAREMSRDGDPELRAMAQEELLEAEERRVGQERALQTAVAAARPARRRQRVPGNPRRHRRRRSRAVRRRSAAHVCALCRTAWLDPGSSQRKSR
jgi:protein subunit release factor A